MTPHESHYPTVIRTNKEIEQLLDDIGERREDGSDFKCSSYFDGVEQAVLWLFEEGEEYPI